MHKHVQVNSDDLVVGGQAMFGPYAVELRTETFSIVIDEGVGTCLMFNTGKLIKAADQGLSVDMACAPYCYANGPDDLQVSCVACVTDVNPPNGKYKHVGLPILVLFKGNLSRLHYQLLHLLGV